MDKDTLNNMPEYIKNLPKALQDMVFDGAWEERTAEIAKKYSLNEAQTENFINTVLFVLIGIESPDTFLQTIITDLGISRLLAEQMAEDLEVRVFEYALRTIQKKDEETSRRRLNIKPKAPTSEGEKGAEVRRPNVQPTVEGGRTELTRANVPEVRPVNLPMVEEGEKVHINQSPKINPPPIMHKPAQELVQRPVSVPRFVGIPTENEEAAAVNPTKPAVQTASLNQPKIEPAKTETKKYTSDPYREPLG